MGETISYSGGDIPYVDRVVKITPDTPLPDSEVIKEIKFLRAALEVSQSEVERLREQTVNQGNEIDKCYREDEELRAEVERLRDALKYISDQAPEMIGGCSYEVSPGGFYRARMALAAREPEEKIN